MVSIFSTGKVSHAKINSIIDKKLKYFDQSLNKVLLNLAKRIVADGEGASKFITVKVLKLQSQILKQKKLLFQLQIHHLVKTAIAGEDPNWGRVIMAIGKSEAQIKINKLSIKFGNINIVQKGKLHSSYSEAETALNI